MALSASTFADLGGAVDAIFGGIGDQKAASGLKTAAGYSDKASDFALREAELVGRSTAITQTQLDRQNYMTLGGQRADIANAGFENSGSALYLMRDSAKQAALSKALLETQGEITQSGYTAEATGYKAQAESYRSQASATGAKADGGFLGGVLKVASGLFGLFG